MTYSIDELKVILAEHTKWIRGEGGARADLSRANLFRATLSGANLSGANLSWANLSGSDLSRANLSEANLLPAFQICEGDLIVYKKVQGKIVTLVISKKTRRTASIVGRKCRSESALILEIEGHQPVKTNGRGDGIETIYEEGKEIKADSYDDDWRIECSHGIHWFLTRKEAEDWNP